MSETKVRGMSVRAATTVEYAIIGLGLLALILIFQPFSLTLFGVGCGLVVLAGLINNLLPLCAPGVPLSRLIKAGLMVAIIFLIVLAVALASAWAYGKLFVGP